MKRDSGRFKRFKILGKVFVHSVAVSRSETLLGGLNNVIGGIRGSRKPPVSNISNRGLLARE